MRLTAILIGSAILLMAKDIRDFTTWSSPLGGTDSAQYSSLTQINKTNVSRLEVAWAYPTEDDFKYDFNPIVVDGVMYVLAHRNSIVALDAATGKEFWRHAFEGSVASRSINYWESKDRSDRRLITLNAGFLTAIDAKTGKTIGAFGDNGRIDLRVGLERDNTPPIASSNPGRIFENLVIIPLHGVGASYKSSPGDIHAYDVRTGRLVWAFHVIPHPGEFGYESWPKDSWKNSGGVMNWNGMSLDEQRGIAYIPLSSPRWDFYGGDRKGPNLYGNSLLALDARTGKRLWHYQIIHHDLWDWDLPSNPQLLTVKHDGQDVDIVTQSTKHGLLFVFNRVTGRPLWPIEERPVPKSDVPGEEAYPTQPWPTKPPPYARMSFTESDINPFLPANEQENLRYRFRASRKYEGLFTPPSLLEVFQMPGNEGAPNNSAIDPTKGILYIVTKEIPTAIKLQLPRSTMLSDSMNPSTGCCNPLVPLGKLAELPHPPPSLSNRDFVPFVDPFDSMISPSTGLGAIGPPWSNLVAVDLNEGAIKWKVLHGNVAGLAEQGHPQTGAFAPRGGPVVTAGGLIFVATASDYRFRAYDQANGKVLWEKELPQGSEGVPTVYQVAGREYIAVPVAAKSGYLPAKIRSSKVLGPASYIAFALPSR